MSLGLGFGSFCLTLVEGEMCEFGTWELEFLFQFGVELTISYHSLSICSNCKGSLVAHS